jgi:hypothetical protein
MHLFTNMKDIYLLFKAIQGQTIEIDLFLCFQILAKFTLFFKKGILRSFQHKGW